MLPPALAGTGSGLSGSPTDPRLLIDCVIAGG
jgi:hypothetical protein